MSNPDPNSSVATGLDSVESAEHDTVVIALVGRPNVGKSTLFNRLTHTRDALVANLASLTRDRKYGDVDYKNRHFIVIDTAGITGGEEGIDAAMVQQSQQALHEADLVFFLLDARAGLTPVDETFARKLRQANKQVFYIANKVDGINIDEALAEFYRLGAEKIYPITATHGRGVNALLDDVWPLLPAEKAVEEQASGTKIAIVGRPNVGKSTLVNRMLGEERVVVYDQPGTTRDSVYINYSRNNNDYTLIDTAGVRRRKNIKETVERFSIVKTLQAIDDAHVVILVIDAQEGLVDQDLHLLGQVISSGRGLVLALNKWDGLSEDNKQRIATDLDRRLRFIDFAEVHRISALHGTGVGNLYKSVDAAYEASMKTLSSSKLTTILEGATSENPPPMVNGRRIKLRYAHMGGSNPPLIIVHGNQTDKIPANYQRYLEKKFHTHLGLTGTPLRIQFKTSENPFAGKRNKLTQRQVNRKRRLMKHVKKKKK